MSVALEIDAFAYEALCDSGDPRAVDASAQLECALRIFLLDRDELPPCGSIPPPYRGPAEATSTTRPIEVDSTIWAALCEEAALQGVDPQLLLNQAALYYAALADSGALTERILADVQAPSAAPHA